MLERGSVETLALATMLMLATATAAPAQERAQDSVRDSVKDNAQGNVQDKKYPNWKGQWAVATPRLPGQQLRFDPSKPYGKGQEAPLTEEYKKVYEANLAEAAQGRQGLFLYHASCLPGGMPTDMSAGTFEYIITPETTYIVSETDVRRRAFTDGRPWPQDAQATERGFSLGKRTDEAGRSVLVLL